jgi:RHS repeat-associated protein
MSSASNTSLQASFTGSSFSAGVSGANMAGGTDPTTSTASLTTPWTTLYAYDTLGNLTCVEQHGGVSGTGCSSPESSDASSPWRVRRFTYNSLSDLITAKNPESGTISYNYNDDGVLTSKTDARGITVTYDPADSPIDELHRVTKKTYSNSDPAVVYSYDNPAVPESIGRRTGMTDASGSTAWTYDDMGRVLTENRTILGVTKATSMQYSVGGFLEKLTYPTGSVVQMTPSGAGHELDAKDLTHGINYATGAKYAPGGQLTDVSVGGVINGKFSFNSRTQPIHLIYTTGALPSATELAAGSCATSAVGTLMDRVYGFASGTANNGNVLTIKNCRDFNRGQTFSYDALNRISRAITSGPNWGESFTIDAWGNLTNRTQLPGKISYEPFNAAPAGADPTPLSHNQLVGYAYDAAGNMLTGPSGASTIAYDAENRISTAGIWSYVYDGEGTRAAKASSGVVSKIYWRGGGSDVLGESDGPGSFTEEYVFFNGRRIGRRDVATGGVEYYLSDHLGTASVIATNLGGNKEESDYYPFGGEIPISGADSNNYKFTTKERDSETGFDYFGARYYVSSIGRWMNPDWADKPEPVPYSSLDNSQSLNLYVYVLNNPLSKADPDGHCCEWAKQQVQVAQRWTADHPRTMMAAKAVGTGLATAAVVTVVVVSAPVSVPATLLTGAAMMGAAGGTVATVTLATGAITGNTKGINDAAEAVQTVSNVAGLAVTVGSGSLEKGSKAAAASDLVTGGKDALGHVDKDVAAAGKLASGLVHAGGAQTAASAAQTLTKPQGPEKKETDQKEK